MCDYSLHAQPNRLAKEGEELTLAIFRGGSRGFAAVRDYEEHSAWEQRRTRPRVNWSWKGIVSYFRSKTAEQPRQPLCVVCIPPGAQLRLEGIPLSMQKDLGLKPVERVTFTQLSCEAYTYRDAVRFDNGKEVLLQWLKEKQKAVVLSLGANAETYEAPTADMHVYSR
jgi:hypothetical protein